MFKKINYDVMAIFWEFFAVKFEISVGAGYFNIVKWSKWLIS